MIQGTLLTLLPHLFKEKNTDACLEKPIISIFERVEGIARRLATRMLIQ